MEVETFFAERWPTLRGILARALAAAGVPAADRDDVLQETALRLYQHRARLDPDRSVDAYARVIALNVWRSLYRRRGDREVLSPLPPEHPDDVSDIERITLAKLEFDELVAALAGMRPDHRDALIVGLISELGDTVQTEPVPARDRMVRMRARKCLAASLRRTAVWVLAGAVAARELLRHGWASPGAAVAGGTTALVVAVASLQATPDATPMTAQNPDRPATEIAAPAAEPHAVRTSIPPREGVFTTEARTPTTRMRTVARGRGTDVRTTEPPELPQIPIGPGPAQTDILLELGIRVNSDDGGAYSTIKDLTNHVSLESTPRPSRN